MLGNKKACSFVDVNNNIVYVSVSVNSCVFVYIEADLKATLVYL